MSRYKPNQSESFQGKGLKQCGKQRKLVERGVTNDYRDTLAKGFKRSLYANYAVNNEVDSCGRSWTLSVVLWSIEQLKNTKICRH